MGNEEAKIAVPGTVSVGSPSLKSVASLHSRQLFLKGLISKKLSLGMFFLPSA